MGKYYKEVDDLLEKIKVPERTNGVETEIFIDTGATANFISDSLVRKCKLKIEENPGKTELVNGAIIETQG